MRKLLLVSATTPEIEPFLDFLASHRTADLNQVTIGTLHVEVLITGVGMAQTAFELGKKQGMSYDFVIQAGVAGSFQKHKNGEVVLVSEDRFSELGAENDADFLTIDELELGKQKVKLDKQFSLTCLDHLQRVKGITVNTVHGNTRSIEKTIKRFNPDIETMEAASFMLAATSFGWNAIALRAISNQVEKRNRAAWELKPAITNLNKVLIDAVKELGT